MREEYNKEEMKQFIEIGMWIKDNYPAMPLGRIHNTANLVMHYLESHGKVLKHKKPKKR